jgi:CheY-specific phosphatase CheX
MSFSGDSEGSLALAVPTKLCSEIAANVLGVDAETDLPDGQASDALRELLNVVCGHVLTALAGGKAVFDLSVPTVRDLDFAGWQSLRDEANTIAFIVDDSPALLRICWEDMPT